MAVGWTGDQGPTQIPRLEVFYNAQPRPPDKSVYWKIIYFISHPKHMLWVLKRIVSMDGSFKHPKLIFKLMGKIIIIILC